MPRDLSVLEERQWGRRRGALAHKGGGGALNCRSAPPPSTHLPATQVYNKG